LRKKEGEIRKGGSAKRGRKRLRGSVFRRRVRAGIRQYAGRISPSLGHAKANRRDSKRRERLSLKSAKPLAKNQTIKKKPIYLKYTKKISKFSKIYQVFQLDN
jgi:hypothetical protein